MYNLNNLCSSNQIKHFRSPSFYLILTVLQDLFICMQSI